MATRLYYHSALSGLTNLPSSRQGDATGALGKNMESQATNRTMTRTIGSSVTNIGGVILNSSLAHENYFTRFVSPPLTAQTISANTWVLNIATSEGIGFANFPVDGDDKTNWATVYIWRPSTQAVVGFIIEGLTTAQWCEGFAGSNRNQQHVEFTGSSVTAQEGDVICQEYNIMTDPATASTADISIWFDGTTVSTTPKTNNTDCAAFLETPQDLVFVGEGPTEMDVTDTITLTNKFITKV